MNALKAIVFGMFFGILLFVFATFITGCGRGSPGPQGRPGPAGSPGPQGSPGPSCTVVSVEPSEPAPNGGAEISCPDGSQSLVLNGTNGTDGAPGTPGTVVQPVQLCDGVQTYPSTFIESAFCLGGKLYGVYSVNGGFLAELPPGQYSSNGVGSSCTFTIGENCQVTR